MFYLVFTLTLFLIILAFNFIYFVGTMNNEKLIKAVRGHSALYNLANPKFMDTQHKNPVP